MDIKNPMYKNQGIHVVLSLFTVEEGKFKVFLIKRKNLPFKDMWTLVGGACYNNETVDTALEREMFEKAGLKNIHYRLFNVYSDPKRSPLCRMIAIGYIGVIDSLRVKFLKETSKTQDADWFLIDRVPPLAYDHQKILLDAINFLKQNIFDTAILKDLFPLKFTLPEIHKAYECILNKKIDRRNFRKSLLQKNIIVDTGMYEDISGKKPSKLYSFKS